MRWPVRKSGHCCSITKFELVGRTIRHLVVLAARYSSSGSTFPSLFVDAKSGFDFGSRPNFLPASSSLEKNSFKDYFITRLLLRAAEWDV